MGNRLLTTENNFVVEYRPGPLLACASWALDLIFLMGIVPLVVLTIVLTIVLLFFPLYGHSAHWNWQVWVMIIQMVGGWFLVWLWGTLRNRKVTLSKDGFVLSPVITRLAGLERNHWNWSDIRKIELHESFNENKEKSVLEFQLPARNRIAFELWRFSPADNHIFLGVVADFAEESTGIDPQLEKIRQNRFMALSRCQSMPGMLKAIQDLTPEESLLADKQLTLKYSAKSRPYLLFLVLFLFPVWGIIGLFGSLAMPFSLPLLLSGTWTPLLMLIFPLLLVSGISLAACMFDTNLVVGETGICFPLHMAAFLQFRRERVWSEIRRFRFINSADSLENGIIDIVMDSGMHVPLSLSALTRSDLEKLLLAISIWGQRIEQDPEIRLLHEGIGKTGLAAPSYTQVWEAELNRKFSSTNFVPLQSGAKLKSHELIVVKQLAFGGMSAIYLAQSAGTDLYVLKEFVPPDLSEELINKAHELFEREARILVKLSHPCLARVHDYFVESGRSYLLLDYIPGADLREIVLQKGQQTEQVAIEWLRQVCQILEYLHSQNPPVLHRDLTPDNILLNNNNKIMLIDFGAANEFLGTATGTLVGKQSFIAPEQFRGETVPASDIYSLGATLFFLLTAEEPAALTQSFPKDLNPQISDWINQLVADCTAYEENDRIGSADALLKRLSKYSARDALVSGGS